MKILYLTQTFPPEPGATIRPFEQARVLADHGFRVTVVTGFPYYPHGRLRPEHRNKLHQCEAWGNVAVHRVWSLPAAARGHVRRVSSFASFALAAFMFGMLSRTLGKHDVVIASVPFPLTEAAGRMLALFWRARFVLELRDLPASFLHAGGFAPGGTVFRMVCAYYARLARRSDLVMTAYAGIARELGNGASIAADRFATVTHGVDPRRFEDASASRGRAALGLEDAFVCVYAGSFARIYDIPNVVRAAELLRDAPRVRFVLVGEGRDRADVAALISELRLDNVTLLDPRPPDALGDILAGADLCIATGDLGGLRTDICDLTTKLCDYLYFGKPVVAVEDEPRMGRLLEEIGAGEWVPWNEPRALAAAIRALSQSPHSLRDRAANAATFAKRCLPRSVTMQPLLERLHRWSAETG